MQWHFINVTVLPAAPNSAPGNELQILKNLKLGILSFPSQYYHLHLGLPYTATARLGGKSDAGLAQVHSCKVLQW